MEPKHIARQGTGSNIRIVVDSVRDWCDFALHVILARAYKRGRGHALHMHRTYMAKFKCGAKNSSFLISATVRAHPVTQLHCFR